MILNKGLLLQPFQKYTVKRDEMVNSYRFSLIRGIKVETEALISWLLYAT